MASEKVKLLLEKITGKIILITILFWFFILYRTREWIKRKNKRFNNN